MKERLDEQGRVVSRRRRRRRITSSYLVSYIGWRVRVHKHLHADAEVVAFQPGTNVHKLRLAPGPAAALGDHWINLSAEFWCALTRSRRGS